MSLFTKRRKIRNENKRKHIEHLEDGWKQIEHRMNKLLSIPQHIEKERPDFEQLEEEERIKVLAEYYNEIGWIYRINKVY